MGLGLWPVVETEDRLYGADEFGGQGDAAFADAVGCAFVGLVDEGDAEGLLHIGDGADEFDGAAFRAGRIGRDGEAVLFGEGADEFDGFGICSVTLAVLGVGETFLAGAVGGFEGSLASDDDRDSDFGAGWRGFFADRLDEGSLFAAGQNGARGGGEMSGQFLCRRFFFRCHGVLQFWG